MLTRLRWFLRRNGYENDLQDELKAHIELEIEEQLQAGLPQDEAKLAAKRALGNQAAIAEKTRTVWRFTTLDEILQDLSFALHQIRRDSAFTLIATLTLAVGIGVTSAVLVLGRSILYQPMTGVSRADELAGVAVQYDEFPWSALSYSHFRQLKDVQQVFTDLTLHGRKASVATTEMQTEEITLEVVGGNYFSLLGVVPILGRTLVPEDDIDHGPAVAMISHSFWYKHFGGRRDAIGKTLRLDGRPFRIVGVIPEDFIGLEQDWLGPPDVWTSLHGFFGEEILRRGGVSLGAAIGRLRPGITVHQAEAQLNELRHLLTMDTSRYRLLSLSVLPASQYRVNPGRRDQTQIILGVLLAVSVLLLLAAVSNAANFLIAKGVSRQKELATRVCLGATSTRIIRQLFTETVVLAGTAGTIGIALCTGLLKVIPKVTTSYSPFPLFYNANASLDVLFFTLLVTVAAVLMFGLIPSVLVGRNPYDRIKGQRVPGRSIGGIVSLRHVILVVQVAISVMLAVIAGLYVTSMTRIVRLKSGYTADSVLFARAVTTALEPAKRELYYRTLLDRLNATPGVKSASIAWTLPFHVGRTYAGFPEQDYKIEIGRSAAGPNYFRTHGVSLIGREFDGSQQDADNSSIINTVLAEKLWPNENPLGKIVYSGLTLSRRKVVIGVVSLDRCRTIVSEPTPCDWVPFPWRDPVGYLRIQTLQNPGQFFSQLTDISKKLNPDVGLADAKTMAGHITDITIAERLSAALSGFAAAFALVVGTMSSFSLFLWNIKRDAPEIALRMAIGATAERIRRRILVKSAVLAAVGAMIGIAASLAIAFKIANQMFQTSPTEPFVYLAVAITVVGLSLLASYLPARTAVRTDPAFLMKQE